MIHHYLSTALRHFRQHKLTTGINVICLALGLACFLLAWGITTYFAHADDYHARAARTVVLTNQPRDTPLRMHTTSWLLGEHLRADFPELEAVSRALWPQEMPLVTDTGPAGIRANTFAAVSYADAQFLRIFDVPMLAGDATAALDQPRSAIVSEALAMRLFGTRDVVGRQFRVSGGETEVRITAVVGSIPQPSHITTERPSPLYLHFDAMLSTDMDPSGPGSQRWTNGNYFTYVVLPADGSLTIGGLNERLDDFARRHVPGDTGAPRWDFEARPIADFVSISMDMLVRADATGISAAGIVRTLGILVLLVACLNYANLATAQSAMRSREIALRRIVGAHRLQVVGQHFFEALLLSCMAGALGVFCVAALAWTFDAPLLTGVVRMLSTSVAGWNLLAAAVLGVSALACLYPAFVLSRARPSTTLANSRERVGPRFVATLLVALQFGAASFLLITVFVMTAQSRAMHRAVSNPASDPLVVIGNTLSAAGVEREVLKQRLLQQPGIEAMTGMQRAPWAPGGNGDPVSMTPEPSAARLQTSYLIVDADFFSTLQIPLIAGRAFDVGRADDVAHLNAWRTGDATVASDYNIVVERALVERLGIPSPDAAIGRVIYRVPKVNGSGVRQRLHIVGVVQPTDVMPMNLRYPMMYVMNPEGATWPIVRISKRNTSRAVAAIDETWQSLAPDVPLRRRFADEQYELSFKFMDIMNNAIAGLAAFAGVIAVMGLVGMSLHVTRRRTHEIAVRKTLGASVPQVLWLLLSRMSAPVVIANVVVWPIVYVLMLGYLNLFSSSVGLTPVPFLLSLLLTLAVACLAVVAQATRAARLKPGMVLRYE